MDKYFPDFDLLPGEQPDHSEEYYSPLDAAEADHYISEDGDRENRSEPQHSHVHSLSRVLRMMVSQNTEFDCFQTVECIKMY